MPDKMRAAGFYCEWDDTGGISDASQKGHQSETAGCLNHGREKRQGAPAKDKVHRHMERFKPAWPENADKGDAGEDQSPLNAEKQNPPEASDPYQPVRGEGAADEQIDRAVVKAPPDIFDHASPGPGVV